MVKIMIQTNRSKTALKRNLRPNMMKKKSSSHHPIRSPHSIN